LSEESRLKNKLNIQIIKLVHHYFKNLSKMILLELKMFAKENLNWRVLSRNMIATKHLKAKKLALDMIRNPQAILSKVNNKIY